MKDTTALQRLAIWCDLESAQAEERRSKDPTHEAFIADIRACIRVCEAAKVVFHFENMKSIEQNQGVMPGDLVDLGKALKGVE